MFFERVSYPNGQNGCWEWIAAHPDGYGRFNAAAIMNNGRHMVLAHRLAYTVLVGPIPVGLECDHLCHTADCMGGTSCPHRRCVNPTHIEPVTSSENHRRVSNYHKRLHCFRGHPYDETNTYHYPNGHRECRMCHRQRVRDRSRMTRMTLIPIRRPPTEEEMSKRKRYIYARVDR